MVKVEPSGLARIPSHARKQDGYTMETLDVYTIDDGVERVIIHDVRPLPPSHDHRLSVSRHSIDRPLSRQVYVCTHFRFPAVSACNVAILMRRFPRTRSAT